MTAEVQQSNKEIFLRANSLLMHLAMVIAGFDGGKNGYIMQYLPLFCLANLNRFLKTNIRLQVELVSKSTVNCY